jgi:serine/threonine protein kinase
MSTTYDGKSASQRLGDFEIVREIGRGGMGVVYEARQVSLNRKVALKVLSSGLGLTPKAVQRFRREAEAAAKLHHTNIVPVYATGEENGTHFYAMELIDGPSLDHVIQQMREGVAGTASGVSDDPGYRSVHTPRSLLSPGHPPANLGVTGSYIEGASTSGANSGLTSSSLTSGSGYFDTVARMMAEVADALEYAHQQGVVHRDMKPSNLLLSPSGRLSINDFGLARMLEQPGMTMSGEFVGTPAYMSPEQITAGRIPLDHRTDIYSLGATLYELLTLEPPHTGQSREQILAQIVQKEPKPPRRIQKKVPVDLETICLKCLEKDPDRRYQTAGKLAEDLRRYVNRFAISARRVGPIGRLIKWARRRPAVAASLGCLLIAVCMALAFAYQAHHQRLQLLDEKIRNAYVIASTGNLKRTEDAIREIEDLGGSTGHVRLLRGMVAYFRGDAELAISELEQAVRLLPENVAARALLADSCNMDGQFERAGQVVQDMASLSPASPEDYVFKGVIQGGQEGIASIDEGIRRSNSPLAWALRAYVWANRAHDSGEREEMEESLADADAALHMAGDNPTVLKFSIYSRVVAGGIYREAKLPEERKKVLQDAERDVRRLEPFIDDLPGIAWPIEYFYEESDDPDNALRVAQRSFARFARPVTANHCALFLYRQDRFAEALQCLNQVQTDLFGDINRAFVLAEIPPDGPRRAREEYEKIARTHPSGGNSILLFLGKKELAVAATKKLRDLPGTVSQDISEEFNQASLQFGCGELSEEKYLTKAGTSRLKQTNAHFDIGLSRLATGDRAGAREHFEKALGARICFSATYFWSRMFLTRMNNDATWPPWIPVKK